MSTPKLHDVVMVGAGPAALSAAIYTTREDIDTVLFEKGVIGGLAAVTDKIDNYPGFPEGVAGLTLADGLRMQAERFGADIRLGEVTALVPDGSHYRLKTTDGDIRARTVLIGTGSQYRQLGVPGEQQYYGRGVHYCATCDGAFYRGKRLAVVGGGNSAAQESVFLTKFATHIDMLVRSDHLRASDVLIKELNRHRDKITIHFNTQIEEISGQGGLVTKARLRDKGRDASRDLPIDGVFVFIGLIPNTAFLAGSGIALDERGMIITDERLATNLPGVYAAGDVRSGATMQIASATGEGATAALMIRAYLDKNTAHVTVPPVAATVKS